LDYDILISKLGDNQAQLVVRNLEDDVKERLRRRAKKHGCSLEELVRDILRDAAKDKSRPAVSAAKSPLCSKTLGSKRVKFANCEGTR
jgi:plasmid stability protein